MEENKFKCDFCNKYYKSYQSLWNHKKRYHDLIMTNNNLNMTNDKQNMTNNMTNNDQSNDQLKYNKKTDNTTCEYCNKKLSAYTHLRRHLKICKNKQNMIKENEELKIKIKQQDEQLLEIIELKKMVAELINNKSTITNNGNNSNNTTNTNNGTINNNNNYITIVPFGKENFVNVSTDEEHLLILKQEGYNAIYKCIEIKHFNEKYPQFHNYMIPNKRTNEGLLFNEDISDFKLVNKEFDME